MITNEIAEDLYPQIRGPNSAVNRQKPLLLQCFATHSSNVGMTSSPPHLGGMDLQELASLGSTFIALFCRPQSCSCICNLETS